MQFYAIYGEKMLVFINEKLQIPGGCDLYNNFRAFGEFKSKLQTRSWKHSFYTPSPHVYLYLQEGEDSRNNLSKSWMASNIYLRRFESLTFTHTKT